jgi:hypothetical protein
MYCTGSKLLKKPQSPLLCRELGRCDPFVNSPVVERRSDISAEGRDCLVLGRHEGLQVWHLID